MVNSQVPIKVLHIIGSLKLGGAQVCLKYLVEAASSEEVENYVYPLRSKDIDMPIEGKVIKLPYRNYDPRKFLAIIRLCKKYNIDIIHAQLHKPIIGALLASFFCKVRVVMHEQGPIFRPGVQYSAYRLLLRLLRSRVDIALAVSQTVADGLTRIAKINPEKIKIVYNAVDLETFTADRTAREQIRKQLEAEPDDIVLGYVGRLSHVKGPDLLIEAMALLLQQSRRYLLVLVGEGPQRELLEKMVEELGIADRVKFLGFCSNVSEMMNAFDIGIMPSRQDACPVVGFEMMSMKIPIVCSGVEGQGDIFTDNVTALLSKENTPARIARCIARLADDAELRSRLAQAAHEYAQRFSAEVQVGRVKQLYYELLERDK